MCEVAADGVQLGHNYTVNIYVLRCRDLPPRLASKAGSAVPLLIIPGPRDPKCGFAVFTSMVLSLFVALGPSSGAILYNVRSGVDIMLRWLRKASLYLT